MHIVYQILTTTTITTGKKKLYITLCGIMLVMRKITRVVTETLTNISAGAIQSHGTQWKLST